MAGRRVTPEGNEQAFLRAICADSDDDLPRLVYADWLDEHGDSDRADLIRLQCITPRAVLAYEMHGVNPGREFALLQNNPAWVEELESRGFRSFHFRRGFPDEFGEVLGEQYADLAACVTGKIPVSSIRFRLPRRGLLSADLLPRLSTLRHLDFTGNCFEGTHLNCVQTFLRYGDIRRLDFGDNRLDDSSLVALASTPGFEKLTSLRLYGHGNSYGQRGVRAVMEHGGSLEFLDMSDRAHDGATVAALLTCGTTPQLRDLSLRESGIDDAHVELLTRAPLGPPLTRLDLSSNHISPPMQKLLKEAIGPATAIGFTANEPRWRDRVSARPAQPPPRQAG